MNKLFTTIKNHKILTSFLIIIVAGVVYGVTKGPEEIKRDYVTVARTTVAQEVDVTGRVEPATEVELAVQSGGKVSAVSVKVGQKVTAGQALVRVSTADLQVRLARQQTALEKVKIVLVKQEPKTNANDELHNAYEDGFAAVADTFVDVTPTINGLDDMFGHTYLADNIIGMRYGATARSMRTEAERHYYLAEVAYKDALKEYSGTSRESDTASIEALINHTYDATKVVSGAVKTMNTFLNYIESEMNDEDHTAELAADRARIDTYTEQANSHLAKLLAIKNTIKNSRVGITDENHDIESINIDIRQAELDIEDTKVQINNRTIYAPITGVITDVRTSVGETISASTPVISLISSNQYQIEANLPESEMAKVSIGAAANVTLDAYGDSVLFKAKVVSINPAATLLDGVATYKTTFQFIENDERIKSGMTADINIIGERKENVLAVPQRAIIAKDGGKYVQVLVGETIVEKNVETGLRGTDGNIEILHGLTEGDKVVVFVETE